MFKRPSELYRDRLFESLHRISQQVPSETMKKVIWGLHEKISMLPVCLANENYLMFSPDGRDEEDLIDFATCVTFSYVLFDWTVDSDVDKKLIPLYQIVSRVLNLVGTEKLERFEDPRILDFFTQFSVPFSLF